MSLGDENPSARLMNQRLRNRVIEYLELAASFEAQRRYERDVPIEHVPYEVINLWQDVFFHAPQINAEDLPGVYSQDERDAIMRVNAAWDAAADATPDNWPTVSAVQEMPEWDQLRTAAASALEVFLRRGRMPEDREVPD